jgi:ribonuclease Z
MRSQVKMGSIDNILLTHLHGDHCYGLFGLMHTLNNSGRTNPVHLYGPQGVQELVSTVFRLTGGWDAFPVNITELEPEVVHSFSLKSSKDVFLASVKACPMVHRIPAFGYVMTEPDPPRHLLADKAKAAGVSGADLSKLKVGEDVTLWDGSVVRSSDMTTPGRPPRTVGVMQDTCDASAAEPFLSDCDLLIHEATFEDALRAKAIQYGHSTSVMAGEFARRVHAKRLALTHFSSRYSDDPSLLRLEAQEAAPDTEVILARDFMGISGEKFDRIDSLEKPL